MRTIRSAFLCTLALISFSFTLLAQSQPMQFIPVAPCRVMDTRTINSPILAGTSRTFNLSALGQAVGCQQSLTPGSAFSLNVTVVPRGYLAYLTIWPTGQPRPVISLMNSFDGRTKANAAIVLGGGAGHNSVDVFVTNTADVILDVNGYFEPANSGAMAYYPLPTPCRLADTRVGGGDPLPAGEEADFPVFSTACGIPHTAQAYSLNFTAVPGHQLDYLTVWPAGGSRPLVSTLNSPTGTIVANAALLPANGTGGEGGEIAVYPSQSTHLVIDIDGYFAPATLGNGEAFFALTPCRAIDTRHTIGAFTGQQTFNIAGSSCNPPAGAAGYVMNASALPVGILGYLTLWPDGQRPLASTLNAYDGAYASNMAIVGTHGGSIDAYASGTTNLLLDLAGYMAPLGQLTVSTSTLPGGTTGQSYTSQLVASGGEPPYSWTITSGSLPNGLTLSSAGAISGIATTAGTFNFTVQVTDQFGSHTSKALSITVVQGSIVVTTNNLPGGNVGLDYHVTLTAAGGTPPYTWSIDTGTLPDGLTLDASSGNITGTPTTTGTSQFTVKATDQASNTALADLQITIYSAINNGSLAGHYAFSLNGYNSGNPVFMAGSFTADGAGSIAAGVLDYNDGPGETMFYTFTGSYTIQNGMGTMTLNVSTLGQMSFSVSVASNGNGRIILNNQDPNTRGSGVLLLQNTGDFLPPRVGTYAIGSNGAGVNFSRYAKAGAFTVSTPGSVTSGQEDVNDNGTTTTRNFTGTFNTPSPLTGRGQAALNFSGTTNTYAYYVISAGQFLMVGLDPLSNQSPMTLGTIVSQFAGNFNDSSLNGNSILEINGVSPSGADVIVGLANWNGGGGGTVRLDENNAGTMTQATLQGSYDVATNGRATTSGFGDSSPILYLFNLNQGFVVGTDSRVLSGVLEQQTAVPPLGNTSILGNYVGGTLTPVESTITDAVSFFQADGNGNLSGSQSYSAPAGPGNQSIGASYQVDASGRAVLTPSAGNFGGVMYVISARKVALLPNGVTPALSVFLSSQSQ